MKQCEKSLKKQTKCYVGNTLLCGIVMYNDKSCKLLKFE